MHFPLELFVCSVFLLVLIRGLPIPSESDIAPFGVFALAYRRRGPLLPDDQRSATQYSPVNRSEVWGGTPANTSICRNPALWTGKRWWIMGSIASTLVLLYGLLASVTWGILSVDITRLIVWSKTGEKQRRDFARKVMKVRNRPDWLLLSLAAVSVAIAEVLPLFWSHLFMSGSPYSYITNNIVICVSQVGPSFVMPVFHLEVSGRFTWLVRLIMWLTAPVTVVPAYALRRLREWRKRGQETPLDGLLSLEELVEFISLHERGQNRGGTVDDDVGKRVRFLLQGQGSWEESGSHVETEGSWSTPLSGSVAPTSVPSLHLEGSTAVDAESKIEPTNIRPHHQEGSTAIEDVSARELRKRGEQSTEGHEPVVSVVSMQVPHQALIKDPIHGSQSPVNNRITDQGALIGLPLRRDYPLENLRKSVTLRRPRRPMMESYRTDRKDSGHVTDSFLFEQRW